MAAIVSGADLTTFSGLQNLEQQITFLAAKLLTLQNAYNDANPTAVKTVIAISPSYGSRTCTLQCQFSIEGDSALQSLHDNITAAIP